MRLQASEAIHRELSINGYSNYLHDGIPWQIINEIDNDLELVILGEKDYDRHEIDQKLKILVSKGTQIKQPQGCIDDLSDFVLSKLERYISSGFTQSYRRLESGNYFCYSSEYIELSQECQELISEKLNNLKKIERLTTNFESLIATCDLNNPISKEMGDKGSRNLPPPFVWKLAWESTSDSC